MTKLNEALMEFQKRFEGVKKERSNTFTQSNYANLDDVWRVAEPLLSKLDLLAKDVIRLDDGRTILSCRIIHTEEPSNVFISEAFIDDSQGAQIFGSELTYKKRYLKCTMLNIVESDDDDGNLAGKQAENPRLTEKQHSEIIDLIEATKTDMNKFNEHLENVFKAKEVEHLTVRQASTSINQLKTKLKRMQNATV